MVEETQEKTPILEAYRKTPSAIEQEMKIWNENELFKKTAFEIIAEKGFVMGADISERLHISCHSAGCTLSHNFKRWKLVRGRIIINAGGDCERIGYSDKIEKIPKTLIIAQRRETPKLPTQVKDFRKSEIPPRVLELIRKQDEKSRKGIRMHR